MESSEIYSIDIYDYEVPQELIAQYPAQERDKSRLLVIDQKGRIEHRIFSDIVTYLMPGDVLVLNETKVIHARFKAIKEDTGGKVDILLIKEIDEGKWEVLLNKKLKPHQRVLIDGVLRGHFINENGRKVIQFEGVGVNSVIRELGLPPLPPYIKRKGSYAIDKDRYQTVYAKKEGSLAAPTAGLHFTDLLLGKLMEMGVIIAKVTLHIGPGTFSPVRVKDIRDHQMGTEFYDVPPETADLINRAKAEGRRIVAVGTTTTRALESASDEEGMVIAGPRVTNLFIYPGYIFKVIDALITNFHLPKSTLLMLVSALAGIERIRYAYKEAIEKGYRFYSYGDAMLIFPQKDV